MNNMIDPEYEEQRNQQFLAIDAKLKTAKAEFTKLEQKWNNAYVGTTAYRLELEHQRLMNEYFNDED